MQSECVVEFSKPVVSPASLSEWKKDFESQGLTTLIKKVKIKGDIRYVLFRSMSETEKKEVALGKWKFSFGSFIKVRKGERDGN
jgi:hypothetical protein